MPIDPNIMSVLLGVVANGLTTLVSGSYNRLKAQMTDPDEATVTKPLCTESA